MWKQNHNTHRSNQKPQMLSIGFCSNSMSIRYRLKMESKPTSTSTLDDLEYCQMMTNQHNEKPPASITMTPSVSWTPSIYVDVRINYIYGPSFHPAIHHYFLSCQPRCGRPIGCLIQARAHRYQRHLQNGCLQSQ